MRMHFHVLTLFPGMFASPFAEGIIKRARDKGLVATGFSGKGGGGMVGLCDPLLLVPSGITARIQEMHITLGHMLCGALEQELGLV